MTKPDRTTQQPRRPGWRLPLLVGVGVVAVFGGAGFALRGTSHAAGNFAPVPAPIPTGTTCQVRVPVGIDVAGPPPSAESTDAAARQWQSNHAYRQRRALSCVQRKELLPYAVRARAGMDTLPRADRADAAAIRAVLKKAGMPDASVRPAGPYDAAAGILYADSIANACVFGQVTTGGATVSIGTNTLDGDCLPAPG